MKNNSTKVWIFVVGASLFFLLLGYNLGSRTGLLLGFLAALVLNILVFFYGENQLLAAMQAEELNGQDPWGLIDRVRTMSRELGIITPHIYLSPQVSVSAFCVGHSWRRSSVCFTRGLLHSLNTEEVDAVIAHQLCHIRRLDTFSFGVSSTLANAVVGLGQVLDSFWPTNFLQQKQRHQIFSSLLSPFGWLIIKLVAGQKAFYENDLMASQLIQDRLRLGQVLWRLEGLSQTQPLQVPPCTSHLFIVNPEGFGQKNFFLKSHPSIESRLKKLLGYYPV